VAGKHLRNRHISSVRGLATHEAALKFGANALVEKSCNFSLAFFGDFREIQIAEIMSFRRFAGLKEPAVVRAFDVLGLVSSIESQRGIAPLTDEIV
jgi:hypothetical protein